VRLQRRSELSAWVDRQARSEEGVVRLEDALLTNSFGRYFFYRLRFLLARTAISTAFHALKIVLLLGAFPRSEFLAIVIAQSAVALVGDFWWGALEQLRSDVRLLQRRGRRDLVPREIARWLSLAVRLAVIPIVVAAVYVVGIAATAQSVGPVELYVVILLGAISLDLVSRAYHSGAYALRRVYRPLPSLLALDVVSVGALLALWPLIGLWAFPVAELISALVVFAIAMHYTTRTYQTLAIPTIVPLLRLRRRVPSWRTLRTSILPGVSYALVGLEALVVVAGIATATTQSGATLVVILAALGPVSRASFEWARLLYFDLKRLELPLLADLRGKFDRAIVRLAFVMGASGAALAAVVTVVLMRGATAALLGALLALFLVRSLLAAAQMQAFTRSAYERLAVAGAIGVAGLIAVFWATNDAEFRLFGVAGALAISLVYLLELPAPIDPTELLAGPTDWLRALRLAPDAVTVARLRFDERHNAPGVTPEARRTEAWRRAAVAERLAGRVNRRAGAATWVGDHELWMFETRAEDGLAAWLVRTSSGLLGGPPTVSDEAEPRRAAVHLADDAVGRRQRVPGLLASADAMIGQFASAFPDGIAYDLHRRPPAALVAMPSDERVEIYRAALQFGRELRRRTSESRRPVGGAYETTALVDDGVLRAIFIAPRADGLPRLRAWRRNIREWNVRRAAGFAVADAPPAVEAASADKSASVAEPSAGIGVAKSEGQAML
jgi:hypothetical protein